MTVSRSRPRSPVRIALWTLVAASAVVSALLVTVTLALPGWIANRGVALMSETLGRPVQIGQAHFQPWRLAVVLDGVRVDGEARQQAPLLTLTKVDAALSLRSLFRGSLVIESLTLTQPVLRLARVAEGRYDIDDLVQRFATRRRGEPEANPRLAVYNIELTDGRVFFDDRPARRKHELAGLELALPFLSTLTSDVEVKVQPRLSGKLDGVAFDSRAEALPFADDASARLALRLAGLELAPLGAYLPAGLPLRLDAGQADVDLALEFSQGAGGEPAMKLSGHVQLHGLGLTTPQGQPLLGLRRLSLPLVDLQPLKRQLGLGEVRIESPVAWFHAAAPGGGGSMPPWRLSVAGLQISDGRVHARGLALDALDFKLGAAAWPLKTSTRLDVSLRLDEATLAARASLSPQALEATAELSGLAIERLAPWLPLPGGAKLTAGVSTRAALSLSDPLADGATTRVRLAFTDTLVRDAHLSLPGSPRLLTLASAQLDKASIEPAARRVVLGSLSLAGPRALLSREPDGRLNILPLLPSDSAAPNASGHAGWKVQIAGLDVERGALLWRDAAVPDGVAPVAVAVEPLQLHAGALSWPKMAPVPVQLSARLGGFGADGKPPGASAGSLQWSGRLGLSPFSAAGSIQTAALPLQLLDAYLGPRWGLHLQRAELGLKAEVRANRQSGGGWQAGLGGDVRIGPLALLQTRLSDGRRTVGEDLLSWQSLQLDGARLSLAPGTSPRLAVRRAQLDDANAHVIVDEQGRLNFRAIGAEAARGEAASAPAGASTPPVHWAVEHLRVNRGRVDFSDRFVRPNVSARLSELQGSLGAFSSTGSAMAPLSVRGKVAGGGLLEIDGQLKPGAPLTLDVTATATDIELASLSPYAARYVGHPIERGKLSSSLHYQIEPGGQLAANHRIVLHQLGLGERVESPDATSLPARLAVALLQDSQGLIEVDLPVSGSLKDPAFSVGGRVWQRVLNPFGMALTSPFTLFSGSDAPDEGQVAFAPASAEPADPGKLDRMARQLADKPGVQLNLTGWSGIAAEGQAIRERRLASELNATAAPTPDLALKRLYEASDFPGKPRNLLGLPKDLPPEQMRGLLLGSYTIDGEALRLLASARAAVVRDALLSRGAPAARVLVGQPGVCDTACDHDWRPHVELSLALH